MWKAEPISVVSTTAVSPVEALLVSDSSSVNVIEVLSVPEFLYFTNKVSGSVPSVAVTATTFATTPDVPPVTVLSTKLFYVPVNDVSLTDL